MHMCIYIYIYIHMCTHIHIHKTSQVRGLRKRGVALLGQSAWLAPAKHVPFGKDLGKAEAFGASRWGGVVIIFR